jgi:hypothetical protein
MPRCCPSRGSKLRWLKPAEAWRRDHDVGSPNRPVLCESKNSHSTTVLADHELDLDRPQAGQRALGPRYLRRSMASGANRPKTTSHAASIRSMSGKPKSLSSMMSESSTSSISERSLVSMSSSYQSVAASLSNGPGPQVPMRAVSRIAAFACANIWALPQNFEQPILSHNWICH